MLSVTLMAIGGGIIEVILSPLVEALPISDGNRSMNFLHTFYCIGHIIVVVFATIFFKLFTIDNWAIVALLLTVFPITTTILFINCPIVSPKGDEKPIGRFKLFKNPLFTLLFVLMVCAGASEQAVAQWISYFLEIGLKVEKSVGDVVGVSSFAICMLISRFYFGTTKRKFNVLKVLIISSIILTALITISTITHVAFLSLVLLALCGLFIGFMWPTVYAYAGEVFSVGGTVMFSMLALGGDLGCTLGPTLVGTVSQLLGIKIGILSSIVFALTTLIVSVVLVKLKNKKSC
jgi:fucose permease